MQCEIEALTLLIEEVSNRFPWLDGGEFLLPNLRDLHSSPNTSNHEVTGSPQALRLHVVSAGIFLPWRNLFKDLETSPRDLSPRKGKSLLLFFETSISQRAHQDFLKLY